jgi:hypothetical protein
MFKRNPTNLLVMLSLAALWLSITSVAAAADLSHARDCATAMLIKPGVEVETAFSNSADRAVYRIVLETRSVIDVVLKSGDASVGNAELLDSSCMPVRLAAGRSAVTGKAAQITVPATVWTLASGVYFVRFSPAPAGKFGMPFVFEAAVRPHFGHDCASAQPLTDNGSSSASIRGELLYPEDRQVFKIVLAEPGQVRAFTTGPLEPPNQPYIDLLMADCSSGAEFQSFDETTMGITTSTLLPGIYFLTVIPEPHTLGEYWITVSWRPATGEPWWESILN